jgi:hypothetical protein
VAAFSASDLQFIQETLSGAAGSNWGFGSFYFSLHAYVRASNGTLGIADLTPGATSRIGPLGVTGAQLKQHLEGDLSLRCIRPLP